MHRVRRTDGPDVLESRGRIDPSLSSPGRDRRLLQFDGRRFAVPTVGEDDEQNSEHTDAGQSEREQFGERTDHVLPCG